MLALTKKTDYALIALWHLSQCDDAVVSSREIATKSGIGLPILTNILKALAHGGMVTSIRGATGGYALAKRVESISLCDVIELIEGPVQLVRCAGSNGNGNGQGCELAARCPIRLPANRVHHRLRQFLGTVTLEELFSAEQIPVEIHTTTSACTMRTATVKERV